MNSFAFRTSLFFAAYFLVVGIHLPFFPVWLEFRGLSATEIAILVSLPMVIRVVFTPVMAIVAGRIGNLLMTISVFSVLGALPIFGLALVDDLWSIAAVIVLSALFWNPILPLTEALAVAGSRRDNTDYGRMRLWGSWSFIGANLLGGWVLSRLSPEHAVHIIAVAYALCAIAAFLLREPERKAKEPLSAGIATISEARMLVTNRQLLLAVLAGASVQASHGVFYTFGTVQWVAQGIDYRIVGGLWALGVLAEIALFSVSDRLSPAFGAFGLLFLAGVAGVVRWTAFAFSPGVGGLVLLQILHGFTFGAAHLGIIQMISRHVPDTQAATAQALYFTVSGLTLGIAVFVAGPAYADYGAMAYLSMAILAGIGALVSVAGGHRG